MNPENIEKCAQREARVMAAVRLEEPDRVPFMPMTNNFFAMSYGIPMYDALRGDRRPEDALRSYLREFEPDWLSLPMFLPARALELAQPANMHWATEDAPNIPFQYTDQCFLETDEDWDDFLRDPTLFLLTRVLPAKYKSLAGLRLLDPYKLCAPVPAGLGSIAAPPLREALLKLIEIADIFEESGKSAARYLQIADEEGVPCKAGHMLSPFDEFGDSLRGFLETSMDMITEPERFAAAVEKWEAVSVPAAMSMAKAMGAKMIHIPLHCGLDEFMSPANYEKYYWPPLKRMIETIIAAGMTPLVITEGNYNSRLEQLCDVPKGKVIYSFEKVDMKRAKQILGGTACIMGNLHTPLLAPGGKREQVVDATKRLIDDCAPGGGYIMSCSMTLDNVDLELLRAWKETTFTYGKYR